VTTAAAKSWDDREAGPADPVAVVPRPAWLESRTGSVRLDSLTATEDESPPQIGDLPRVSFDLRLLQPFLVLAEERHFGRASERLACSRAGLSNQMQRLETQLGVVLFSRGTRALRLTAAGVAFRRRAQFSFMAATDAGQHAVEAASRAV
jgi:hypothetical protein